MKKKQQKQQKQQNKETVRSVERVGKVLDLTKGGGNWGFDRWIWGSPDWQ